MDNDEIRATLGSLVSEVDEMIEQGAALGDPVFDEKLYELVTFWLSNRNRIKWAYWWGDSKNTKSIVDCYTLKG